MMHGQQNVTLSFSENLIPGKKKTGAQLKICTWAADTCQSFNRKKRSLYIVNETQDNVGSAGELSAM